MPFKLGPLFIYGKASSIAEKKRSLSVFYLENLVRFNFSQITLKARFHDSDERRR